jgi:anti-sigma factor RsiW
MRCERIEKLLPLYVEDDLSAQEMEGMRVHLSTCEACRGLEAEFRSSQAMLHNFDVPEFGAEFYEQIRGTVLAEINSRPLQARPSLFQMLGGLLQFTHPAFAASLALLLLCGALSLILYRSVLKSDGALVSIEKSMGDFEPGELPADAGRQQGGAYAIGNSNTGVSSTGARERDFTARNIVRQKRLQSEQATRQRERSSPQGIDEGVAATVTPSKQQVEGTAVNSSPTQAVARMEIQTSDPNIRIIWLGQKQANIEK